MKTVMKILSLSGWKFLFFAATSFVVIPGLAFGQKKNSIQFKYLCLPLAKNAEKAAPKILDRFGVPFIEETLKITSGGSVHVDMGCQAKQIFLLGMTESPNISCWADPADYSVRCFIGDETGKIRLDYADGSTQVFPLISGESIWWGQSFFRDPGPFPTDLKFRKALAGALRLYPSAPVKDGNYVAVITPKPVAISSITIESSSAKRGTPAIAGITVESAEAEIAGATVLSVKGFSKEFKKFIKMKSLRPLGEDENQAQRRLNTLRLALYTSDADFKGHIATQVPQNYSGPKVSFNGDNFARILTNAFSYNLQDIANKIDEDGTYHTSTKGALQWGDGGGQFGTFRTNAGNYYADSWSRDVGRSLQEFTILGYTNEATHCADYCLRMARLWEEDSTLRIKGEVFPMHWSRVINKPNKSNPYENDGHGLITMFLYKLWQRMPDRNEWLRSRWQDVKATGDWILWQFDHPEISGAKNGVLRTTGESAGGNGYSVYADYVCMDALRALRQMAESIGDTNSIKQWSDCAAKMNQAIARQYIINDPKYGPVWTLDHAGWPTHPSVLGPLIFSADYQGFAPEDADPVLHAANKAAYQRLIDTYKPFGFYGQAMGYGQGFVTQSALLLDRMHDATTMLEWIAKAIYDPKFGSFIVPEGVQMDPTSHFWYRAGDLGNGVQEAEIIKTLRIVIGVDDTQPSRLQFFPRMPYGWSKMAVEKYPVLCEHSGKMENAFINYKLERSMDRLKLEIASDKDLGEVTIRLGPFRNQPGILSVLVNGENPKTIVEHSGDSWWVRFTMTIGPVR